MLTDNGTWARRGRRLATSLLLLAASACTRKLPPELALPPDEPSRLDAPVAFDDLAAALRWLIGDDPLARRITPAPRASLLTVDGGEALADALETVDRLERRVHTDRALALQVLERKHRGTPAVAIARGYALGLADHDLATYQGDPKRSELSSIAPLLSPLLTSTGRDDVVRHPLEFIGGARFAENIRRHGDHRTLSAWLDGPGIPLAPVADAMEKADLGAVADTTVGRLIRKRASGASGDIGTAWEDLLHATTLFLEQVSADRNSEQSRWKTTRADAAKDLGMEDPIVGLLERAREQALEGAADDRAAGIVWQTELALRWLDRCTWKPCEDLSRTSSMVRVASFHPDLVPVTAAWRGAALKHALDSMDVGHETVAFPLALVDLSDALLGTGASPLSMDLLRRRAADPKVWSWLTAAIGSEEATTWEDARISLSLHLERVATQALEGAREPDQVFLKRIRDRAVAD